MKIINKWIAVLTAFLMTFAMLPAGLAFAQTAGNIYYVSKTAGNLFFIDADASDGGDGLSEATAFNNLAEAGAAIVPGVTVLIKPGSYTGNLDIEGTGETGSKAISIKKLGEGTVNIDGGPAPAISLTDIANVSIEGLSLSSTGNSALLADGAINCDISDSVFTTAAHGIEITGDTSGCDFYNNTFDQNDQKGILLKDSVNNRIYNNIFRNYKCILNEDGSFADTFIMNNVFVSYYGDGADIVLKGADTGNTIANNIFKAEGAAAIVTSDAAVTFYDAGSDNIVDYNLYDVTSSLAGKPENEAHSIYGDPLFAGSSDYHLQLGSAAINRGTDENAPALDRDGGARFGRTDIGAYEYAGDSSAFYVVNQEPQGTGIKVDSSISIAFSEKASADNNNFTDNISVTTIVDDSTVNVAGSFSEEDDGDGTRITFTPAADLNYDATYTVTVKKDLISENGNYLPGEVKWNFNTEAFIMDAYYIAPNGKDSNPGTIDSPKKTVSSSLISKLKAGDTIYFREGTYNGIIVMQLKAGTADKPITLKSYENEKAVLTADDPDYIIYLGHCQHINIEGLTFAPNMSQNGTRGVALRIDNHSAGNPASADIKVAGCRFENSEMAIAIRDLANVGYGDFEFSNNVIVSNDSCGFYFQEVREKAGSYGKIFNNVIYGASRSISMWGKSSNLLFYNNTFADVYDAEGGSGRYDVYPVQGTLDAKVSPINISTDLVFKNNIFTKPVRTQLEGGKSIIDASQNCIFDNNIYSIAGTQRITYNGGGEGPALTLEDMQSGTAWANQGRPLEVNGRSGNVTFADVSNDARIIFDTNPAIGTADTSIIPGVPAPQTDINGNARTRNEAGAYAFDETFAFVGHNSGTADGSPANPYPSIAAAVNAGAKTIQVIAGTYEDDENIDMQASAGAGDVLVMPYNGEVIFNGALNIAGSAEKAFTIKNITLAGNVTLSGAQMAVDGCNIRGELALNQATGAVVTNNIFAPKAAAAIVLSGSENCLITNNVITERQTAAGFTAASASNRFYNNTFYENEKDVDLSADSTGNIFKNNIFSTKIDNREGNTFDYNLYNADTIAQADLDSITTGIEAHAVKASPDFINAGAKDYRIYKLSECAGAGIMDEYTPAKDIKGIGRKNPPDIGAYAVTAIEVSYYVDAENGSDENPGTAEAPFETIAAGLGALRNGEAVIVKAGTYNEDMALTDRVGQEANDYVIKADGNVILNGSIILDNAAGVTIDGFTVNAGADGTAVSLNASPKATLNNLTIGDTKNGISAADSEELSINKVNIRNVEKGIVLNGADKASQAAVSQTKIDNAGIVAVEAKNQIVLTLSSSLINNSAEGILGTGESSFFIFNNTFYNNSGYSIDITQADGHAANLDIINNIFSRSSRGQGAFTRINKGWGFNSEYNLYDAAADEAITYFYGANQDFAATVQNGDETMGRIGDPMFKDAASGDFTLAKGSPAARNGVKSYTDTFADESARDIPAPKVDYSGTAYSALGQDIGAYYTPYSLKTIHLAGDNAGSLDGDGTEEHPFRTFAQAIDAADSGDTIIVHKGIYTGRYDINDKHGVADAPIIIKASTDPNDPLDLKNASLPSPIFTGKSNYADLDEEAAHECMTKITGSSYITIEGLNVTGFRGAGIWLMDCDNIVLKNLKIWDIDTPQSITSGVEGLLISGTTNSLLKDIDIWDIGQTRKSQADHGAYIGHCSNLVIDGLKVSKAPGGGIQFYSGDNYNIHSTNCVIKNSVFSESNLGLILCGIEGFVITNNTFYNTWGEDLYMDWNVRGNLIQNNIFYNDRTEEYDSVYGKVKPVIVCYQNNTLKSNADGSTTEMVIDNTFRNNIYEYKTFPANCRIRSGLLPIKEFMANENAATANNRYTDMFAGDIGFKGSFAGAADDYEKAQRIFDDILDLKSDSDCIDKGFGEYAPTVDILGRSRIGKPDLGAYEFVSNGGDDNDDEDNNDDNNGNDNNNNGNNNNGNNNGNNNNNNNNGNNSNANEKSTIAVTGKLGSHGEVNAEVTSEQLDDAFKAAKEDGNGVRLAVIKIGEIEGAAEYVQKLPANALMAAGADKRIRIETPVGTITVPSNMMTQDAIGNAASIELSIRLADKSEISDDLKAAIGDRPVIDLSLRVDGRTIAWDNPEAPATVSVAYTPSAEELKDPEHIVVWYIDGNGEAVSVPSGRYDPATGKVTFTASHFSRYAVTFVHKTFNDTAAYGWAEKEIGVLASKGVIDGTSDTTYAPGKNISRADFIVLLVRGLGLAAKADSNFSDVSADSYYYEAVGIAKKLGITEGVGGNRFDPKAFVTRQDMMVLAGNAMRAAGKPAVAGDAGDLARFNDSSKIAAYAKTSISSLVRDGIVQGDGSLINPLGSATRAEAAVMIYRIYNK